ncbi:MAG: hemolysin III family protein [Bacteroidaceae bacterium]|nr:hemolysin III family protein [Bacteroidaceae bacterium]
MTRDEIFNTWTHGVGVLFTLAMSWLLLIPAYGLGWVGAMSVTVFVCGMLTMYLASTIYHLWRSSAVKRTLRIIDHIGIYVMIAASYTPICLCVVGGWLGWLVFALLWAVVVAGAFYKIFLIGRWPALSLGIYLAMGWSGVLMAVPVYRNIGTAALVCILCEGLFYTSGTYFYARDSRPYYHGIWHLFVLAGSIAHWLAVYFVVN